MSRPNFLIIGAAKAGTTSLYEYLKLHPQVFMSPIKETNYFALASRGYEGFWHGYALGGGARRRTIIDTWEKYEALFAEAGDAVAVGEASPAYMYVPEVAQQIKDRLPDVKLVAILRNPIDRAYSHFVYYTRDGRERQETFREALFEEEARIRRGEQATWSYAGMGFYYEQLRRYFDHFDAQQLRVYLFEDLRTDPAALLRDLSIFLEIDPEAEGAELERHNSSGLPRSRWLQRILVRDNMLKRTLGPILTESNKQWLRARLQQLNLRKAPSLAPEDRLFLNDLYRDDVLKLEQLLGRDLSHWLAEPGQIRQDTSLAVSNANPSMGAR